MKHADVTTLLKKLNLDPDNMKPATENDLLDQPSWPTDRTILHALNQRQGVILVLLDMSAAFDIVDHDWLRNSVDPLILI